MVKNYNTPKRSENEVHFFEAQFFFVFYKLSLTDIILTRLSENEVTMLRLSIFNSSRNENEVTILNSFIFNSSRSENEVTILRLSIFNPPWSENEVTILSSSVFNSWRSENEVAILRFSISNSSWRENEVAILRFPFLTHNGVKMRIKFWGCPLKMSWKWTASKL